LEIDEAIKKHMKVAHVGSMHKVNLLKIISLLDINYKIEEDYEFLIRKMEMLKDRFCNKIKVIMKLENVIIGSPLCLKQNVKPIKSIQKK
jgi:hypothetical protein